jgi:CRISPR-associated protein Cas2
MSRPDHLFVFAYDVVKDNVRTRLADLLDEHADRVQDSVFEARMTAQAAEAIGARAARLLGPDDSLRVYCITQAGLPHCRAHGVGVPPEADDFLLV